MHPRYLDRQGLIACWRETLLAQAVLAGRTRGYTAHPQLERFRECGVPLPTVGFYLGRLADEADVRGYRFDRTRIDEDAEPESPLPVTEGQIALEWRHLMAKLDVRNPELRERWADVTAPEPHPLFRVIPGPVAPWERAQPDI